MQQDPNLCPYLSCPFVVLCPSDDHPRLNQLVNFAPFCVTKNNKKKEKRLAGAASAAVTGGAVPGITSTGARLDALTCALGSDGIRIEL